MLQVEVLDDSKTTSTKAEWVDGGWKVTGTDELSPLDRPVFSAIGKLPLDGLEKSLALGGGPGDKSYVSIFLDRLGAQTILVANNRDTATRSATLDGSAYLPTLSADSPADVEAAIAEITAVYGHTVVGVRRFSERTAVELIVPGVTQGIQVMRAPTTAPEATIRSPEAADPALQFDVRAVDVVSALKGMATIGERSGITGTVWDWQISRPPIGGEPMTSYGIGEDGPSTRVWLNADGSIAAINTGDCVSGWCAG